MSLKRLYSALPSLVSVGLLLASLWVIRQELQAYEHYNLWQQIAAIPRSTLGWAIALTFLNGLVFTGYDTLAARYIRHPLPYYQTALAAITSIPISNTVGVALLSGSAVRYRLYSLWGMSPFEITQVIAFCNLSFWLGLLSVGGLLFLIQPVTIPIQFHLPLTSTYPIGVIFLSAIAAYVMGTVMYRNTLILGRISIPHMPIQLCIGQIIISSLDWLLAALILYTLLPPIGSLSYSSYLAIYLLAQLAGIVSNVPGGLGVFETAMILSLTHSVPSLVLLSVLVVYRILYYLLPLAIAMLVLGWIEQSYRCRIGKS